MSKKYFIITYGCQMNKSDSERIAASLEKKGYKPASKENTADLIVVNMCSVRQSAVDRVFGLVQKFNKLKDQNSRLRQGFGRQAKPKTILTGCILKVDKKKFENKFDLITNKEEYLKCPPKYQDKNIALVPISNGCNNFCTYCVVPFTRGRLVCRSYKEIIQEVKNAVKKGTNPIRNAISNGAREIWLLGQNVNDYHSPTDSTVNFAKLLKMVNGIPGDFKIRIMSPNPKNFSDELIEVMAKSEKFSRYLNLPVQSGDNEILKKMNRPYIVEQYKNLVRKIIKKIPDINLSTDIIVGFPGETKKQFENTVKLFREIKFDMAYIAKYSPRPGTAAFLMKDNVPFKEKKRRWKILNDIILKTMESKGGAEKPKLVVILGPTASGKSDLAVKLAKNFKGEIISADSRQVYQGLNIGTAKPAKKERKLIKHHLINIRKPNQSYTVWEYKREAISAINQIIKKERIPILCGGTGLYIKAIVDNLEIPTVLPDWKLRKKIELKIKKNGLGSVYRELIQMDPEAAYIIDKNNPRRIIRALEIAIKTKKPFSQQRKMGAPLFDVLEIGLGKDLKEVKKKIEKRADKMIKMGLVKEVKNLIKTYDKNSSTFDAIGYREIIDYLNGKTSLPEAVEKIKKNTCNFAKRQMTWFKKDKRIKWIKNYKEAEKSVKKFLRK